MSDAQSGNPAINSLAKSGPSSVEPIGDSPAASQYDHLHAQVPSPTGDLAPEWRNVNTVSTTVNVAAPQFVFTSQAKGVPFILRAIWFVFIGFWLSGLFIFLGYLFTALLITMPLGFWFLNRVPQAQTLRMRSSGFQVVTENGVTQIKEGRVEQYPWYVRLLYFPVGLVLGFVWLTLAWGISLLIITLPLSVWMIDRSPAVITLQRN